MKRTLLQKVQYLIQERDHERAMREVLQLIKPSAYANNRELMTEAAKLRDRYSTHAICDALQIKRSTFLNHIFRSKGENSVYAIRDRQLSEEISGPRPTTSCCEALQSDAVTGLLTSSRSSGRSRPACHRRPYR